MNYAIIENEEFARENLRKMIESLRSDAVCLFQAETVADAVNLFTRTRSLDLAFMDIELDDGVSFDIFNQFDVNVPVIFTTAYDEYAIRAFKVNSIDYLLKPFGIEDVDAAIWKYEQLAGTKKDFAARHRELARTHARSRLLINTGNTYTHVRTGDIAWVESGDKYISIILKSGRSLLTDFTSLSDVLGVLDPEEFYQISRSVIVSIGSIEKVSKYFKGRLMVQLHAGEQQRSETVSAARRDDFLDWLGHLGH